jgi:hypothetical protein
VSDQEDSDYSDEEMNSSLLRSQILEKPEVKKEDQEPIPAPVPRTSLEHAAPPRRTVPPSPPSPPAVEEDEEDEVSDDEPTPPQPRQEQEPVTSPPTLVSTRASPSPPPPPSRSARPVRDVPHPDTLSPSSGREILDEEEGGENIHLSALLNATESRF